MQLFDSDFRQNILVILYIILDINYYIVRLIIHL